MHDNARPRSPRSGRAFALHRNLGPRVEKCAIAHLRPAPGLGRPQRTRVGGRSSLGCASLEMVENFVGHEQRRHQKQTVLADLAEFPDQTIDFGPDVISESKQALLLAVPTAQSVGPPVERNRDVPHSPVDGSRVAVALARINFSPRRGYEANR